MIHTNSLGGATGRLQQYTESDDLDFGYRQGYVSHTTGCKNKTQKDIHWAKKLQNEFLKAYRRNKQSIQNHSRCRSLLYAHSSGANKPVHLWPWLAAHLVKMIIMLPTSKQVENSSRFFYAQQQNIKFQSTFAFVRSQIKTLATLTSSKLRKQISLKIIANKGSKCIYINRLATRGQIFGFITYRLYGS